MSFKKTFVVSTEVVNSYGFVIKTSGIRLDNARKNCPCFYDHHTWETPVGHWENLRIDNNRLLADVVIDGANEREKEYIRKLENGDIKGASIGVDPITWSDDPSVLMSGQTKPTLVDSELFEISITPLPGNSAALALKTNEGLITLSETNKGNLIPDLNKKPDMKQIALRLGLADTATEQEILAAIEKLQLSNSNTEAMRKHIEEAADAELPNEESKKLFVELSKTNITAALSFLKLSRKAEDGDAATTTVVTEKGKLEKDVKVSELIKKGSASLSKSDDGKDSFDYLQRHDKVELARIHKEEPDRYAELAKGYQNGIRYKGK